MFEDVITVAAVAPPVVQAIPASPRATTVARFLDCMPSPHLIGEPGLKSGPSTSTGSGEYLTQSVIPTGLAVTP